jgi:DeoR/GlpR family transcriptional regulator of sugar metabolism
VLKRTRQEKIKQYIETHGLANVQELAEQFNVSDMTVRRDLEDLRTQNVIERIHGGAVSKNASKLLLQPPLIRRMDDQREEKQAIGRGVEGLLENGEKIFLGSGTTTYWIADAIKNRSDLIVFTNALTVANLLAFSPVSLIVIGGMLRKHELSLIGHFALSSLEGLRVDTVIFGTYGIHPEYGLTSDHPEEIATDQALMKIGNQLIIVADHTKFGTISTSRTARITEVDIIITSNQTPSNYIQQIKSQGVEVICV